MWVVFSGQTDVAHLTMGVLSAGFVTILSADLWFENRRHTSGERLREVARLPGYLLWLTWQIILANIHVVKIALSPDTRKELDPHIVRFEPRLRTDWARFVLAQSITLTPGTVTVKVEDGEFTVHAISRVSALGLRAMCQRVANLYGDEHGPGGEVEPDSQSG